MDADLGIEQAIQALLDGRRIPLDDSALAPKLDHPVRVLDLIASANRVALFGADAAGADDARRQWGHLEIRGEIGRGAGGTVYRAWDPRLSREVALKLLAPDRDGDEALDEGRLLARLNHPHIVKVFGADIHDGVAGIWMELLDGETLDASVARDGVFGAEETLLVGIDLAGALAAVHAAGLLHRDVKGRNVLRERGGRLVLTDLGAGRPADRLPRGGSESGTPMYMAPEVLAGAGATPSADVYALGVLLYRLLAGEFPVSGDNLADLRAAHAAGARIALSTKRPDLPPDTVAAIERACSVRIEERYATAAETEAAFADALQRIVARRAATATPAVRRWNQWKRPVVICAITVAAAAFVGSAEWNTTVGRSARRSLGFIVPPRSPLYLTSNGELAILRGRNLKVVAGNPGGGLPIAVSTDLGIRTITGEPVWTTGAHFRLDGELLDVPPIVHPDLCCFDDGTTDGRFNYTARTDSTLLDQIGSRPLEPPAVYRFDRDWSHPVRLFPLAAGGEYHGIGYSAATDSFWLTRNDGGSSVIEEWSRDGRLLSRPVGDGAARLMGIAVDPSDSTLWVGSISNFDKAARLENFDRSGRLLGSFPVDSGVGGLEFEWTGTE